MSGEDHFVDSDLESVVNDLLVDAGVMYISDKTFTIACLSAAFSTAGMIKDQTKREEALREIVNKGEFFSLCGEALGAVQKGMKPLPDSDLFFATQYFQQVQTEC